MAVSPSPLELGLPDLGLPELGLPELWLIVGASSSVARALARRIAERGARLVLAGRDREDLQRTAGDLTVRGATETSVVDLDIRDPASRADLIRHIATMPGTLNAFIAVGVMPPQTDLDAAPDRLVDVIATNLTGIAVLLSGLAPRLESQGRGQVIVLGSVAGDRGRLKNYGYGASKAGLHVWLQGFRARLHRSGVAVLTVKPGFLDTAMTWGIGPLPLALSPEAFADQVLRAAATDKDVLYVPWMWRWIMVIIGLVPEKWFKRTNI